MTHSRETATLRDLGLDRRRISLASGRDSDIRPAALAGDDTENTFVFTVPQRELQDKQLPDGLKGSPNRDSNENYDLDDVDGIEIEEPEEPEEANTPEPTSSHYEGADVQMSLQDTTLQTMELAQEVQKTFRKKRVKVSKHGIQYPSLPANVVKKLVATYARTSGNSKAKISKDTVDAIMQASDWFFEQVSDDLCAYAKHAGRKTIDESDIVALMKRCVLAPL